MIKKSLQFTIILILPFIAGCINNEQKYQDCINACEENKTCVEKEKKETGGRLSTYSCIKYNDGECRNICVQKYK